MATHAPAAIVPTTIVDVLLPNRSDQYLDEIANAIFLDGEVAVPVSPVDQLLMAFVRRLVMDRSLGGTAAVQLPRAEHRSALLLAITSHLLCGRPPVRFGGPVVLVAFDVDLASQLRSLGVQNHRRMGLAAGNPLSAHRLTRLGEIVPVIGTEARPVDSSLVYFNTRVGRPDLACSPPLVILDATSVAHPAARTRALEWALDHGAAATVAVGDIGDEGLIETMTLCGSVPTVLAVTESIGEELVATFNRGHPPASTFSSMSVLTELRTEVVLHRVPGDEVNEAVTKALGALAGKPEGPMPPELDLPLNLLRNGTRLAARVRDYRTACTNNTRPGEMPLIRLLDRAVRLPPSWRTWEIAKLGALRTGVKALWREIEETNPKLRALWSTLDEIERTESGPIAVRCHSRAAAEATLSSLSSGERTEAQVELWDRISARTTVTSFKQRFPAGSFGTQVLAGAPPPWLFSLLVGIEAKVTHVLVYDAEAASLERQASKWASTSTGWQQAACRTFHADALPPLTSPVPGLPEEIAVRATNLSVPGLSLAEVLDMAAGFLDPPETDAPGSIATTPGAGARTCVPVHLDDGRTWWCAHEDGGAPVLVVTAGGHEHRLVGQLRRGDRIVVPAGEGTESIHARLLAASRGRDDARNLDSLLTQFRTAARALLQGGGTQRDAIDKVRADGAQAADQLPQWAKGATIAPREPGDVEAVFRAAGRPCTEAHLNLIYAVASKLRSHSRVIGKFIAAIATGRGEREAAVERLRELVGPIADELLDEFIVAVVEEVGVPCAVPSSVAGRVR